MTALKVIKKCLLKAILFPIDLFIKVILKLYIIYYKMEIDDILEKQENIVYSPSTVIQQTVIDEATLEKKEKLIIAINGGGKYVDKKLTVEALNNMTADQINKEFEKYERKLGAVMVKTLGKSMIDLYSMAAGHFLKISPENQLNLMIELNDDPFLDHALNKVCCEFYYKFGMFLAPLTASLTTLKYCDLNALKNGGESRAEPHTEDSRTSTGNSTEDSRTPTGNSRSQTDSTDEFTTSDSTGTTSTTKSKKSKKSGSG